MGAVPKSPVEGISFMLTNAKPHTNVAIPSAPDLNDDEQLVHLNSSKQQHFFFMFWVVRVQV